MAETEPSAQNAPAATDTPAVPAAAQAEEITTTAAAPRERVRVAVRVRPLTGEGATRATTCAKSQLKLKTAHDEKQFKFDVVFDEATTQEQVYARTASELVARVFDGRNATIMAYGQTGSGKTFTMGEPLDMLAAGDGVIARALQDVFERSRGANDATIGLSYLEVYNEAVYDLLAADDEPLIVREDASGNVVVPGLTEATVAAVADAGRLLHRGALRRRTGATQMNDRSSRSHALLQVRVRREGGAVGKLVLVDLAGSERAARTQAQGARLREGIEINKGLLALGNVVAALAANEERKGPLRHAPFRNSKLTRLLKDSLGGTASTWVVACVSPRTVDAEETVNTLRYASRARAIANTAVRHCAAETPEQLLIAALRRENGELRARLAGEQVQVPTSDHDALYEARRKQESAEGALVAARAEALAATLTADRARVQGKDLDLVTQLRAELADCKRRLAAAEPGAPPCDSEEAQQHRAVATLKEEERRMGELRAQFALAVKSLDAEVSFLEQARDKAAKDLNDATSRKKPDAFSKRREDALRDALERRRKDLESKRKELRCAKQESTRVEGLRRRAEAEVASLRVKAEALARRRVEAEKRLRSETSQRLVEKRTAAHELARAQRTTGKSQAEVARLKAQHAREAHVLRRRADEAQARGGRAPPPSGKASDLKHLSQRLDAHLSTAVDKHRAGVSAPAYAPTSAADARLALRWYHDRLVKAELRAPPVPPETRAVRAEKVRPRGQVLQPARRKANLFRPRAVESGSEFEASSEDDDKEEAAPNVTRRRKKPVVLEGDGLDGMTVPQLKDKLRPLALKLAGRKSELVARLRTHYASSDGSEALAALVDADAARSPEAPAVVVASEEPVAPEAMAALSAVVPEATAPSADPSAAAAPPIAPEESVVPEAAATPTVKSAAPATFEEPSTAEDTAKATRRAALAAWRAALAARRAAVAARRAAAAPSVDPAAAEPSPAEEPAEPAAPEVKRPPRLSSVLASISLATGAVAEAAAARAPRREVLVDEASAELDFGEDTLPPPPPPVDEETGERVVASACRRSWLASDGLSFAASGTAATRRLAAVSAAFPSPRLCQPTATPALYADLPAKKHLEPKRAGRKAFGAVNR